MYGYISWVDGRAILTARNPDRRAQRLSVPFDTSVYFRGKNDAPYHARIIYPYVEEMPWSFTSGHKFNINVPGDSILIMEIESGPPSVTKKLSPSPLPRAQSTPGSDSFEFRIPTPDEKMARYDLLVQVWGTAKPLVTINGKPTEPRLQDGGSWTLSAYDLRSFRGKTVTIDGHVVPTSEPRIRKDGKLPYEAWIVADRSVAAPDAPDEKIPFPISQHHRRQTQQLIPKSSIVVRR